MYLKGSSFNYTRHLKGHWVSPHWWNHFSVMWQFTYGSHTEWPLPCLCKGVVSPFVVAAVKQCFNVAWWTEVENHGDDKCVHKVLQLYEAVCWSRDKNSHVLRVNLTNPAWYSIALPNYWTESLNMFCMTFVLPGVISHLKKKKDHWGHDPRCCQTKRCPRVGFVIWLCSSSCTRIMLLWPCQT